METLDGRNKKEDKHTKVKVASAGTLLLNCRNKSETTIRLYIIQIDVPSDPDGTFIVMMLSREDIS